MKKLGLLVAPVLLTLACGGVDDILGGTDGSTVSPCAAGVVPYQVKTGVYTTVSVPSVTENCGLGLTAANLMTDRELANDGQGNLTLFSLSTTPKSSLGTGMVSCNMGTLKASDITNDSAGCDFSRSTSLALTVTAANQITIAVTQTRSNFKQDASGMTCKVPAGGSCTVSYTANMKQ